MGVVDAEQLGQYLVVGELGLDGRVAPVPGVLLAALHASEHDLGMICPADQGGEAAWAGRIEVLAAPDLLTLFNHFRGTQLMTAPDPARADKVSGGPCMRSEEHTSELPSLMRTSYAVCCLKKKSLICLHIHLYKHDFA